MRWQCKCGRTEDTDYTRCRKCQAKRPQKSRSPDVSAEQRARIKRMREAGMYLKEVAELTGLSVVTVSRHSQRD